MEQNQNHHNIISKFQSEVESELTLSIAVIGREQEQKHAMSLIRQLASDLAAGYPEDMALAVARAEWAGTTL